MASQPLPLVQTRLSKFGVVEEYAYPPGKAETGEVHAHREVQVCLSLDFPGRYAYGKQVHDVPIGAVSVLDAWIPHAPRDPMDRDRSSHYVVMYLDPVELRSSVDLRDTAPLAGVVRVDREAVNRFRRLHRTLMSSGSLLQQDERYRELAQVLLDPDPAPVADVAMPSLVRARDYIAAHVVESIALRDVAAVAGLTPWHFTRAFRRQFGIPPHRLQLWLRIDRARRWLAEGMSGSDVAQRAGFADQSHFIRCFKRLTGTTPSRFRTGRYSR